MEVMEQLSTMMMSSSTFTSNTHHQQQQEEEQEQQEKQEMKIMDICNTLLSILLFRIGVYVMYISVYLHDLI
jgi:uncharacterized protein YqhQ